MLGTLWSSLSRSRVETLRNLFTPSYQFPRCLWGWGGGGRGVFRPRWFYDITFPREPRVYSFPFLSSACFHSWHLGRSTASMVRPDPQIPICGEEIKEKKLFVSWLRIKTGRRDTGGHWDEERDESSEHKKETETERRRDNGKLRVCSSLARMWAALSY